MDITNSRGLNLSMQEKETLLNEYNRLHYYSVVGNDTQDDKVEKEFILNMSIYDMLTSISNAVYEIVSGLFNPDNWNVENIKTLFFDKDKFAQIGTLFLIIGLFMFIIYISN